VEWFAPVPATFKRCNPVRGIATVGNPEKPRNSTDRGAGTMATVAERHPGGRPRTREPSALFLRVQSMAKRRGMHIDDLAAAAGITPQCIYQLKDPRVSTARAIADALGVTLDRLTRDESASKRTTRQRSA